LLAAWLWRMLGNPLDRLAQRIRVCIRADFLG
jgi:hypothetical protein